MRTFLSALCVTALLGTVAVAQDATQKPAEKKAGTAHSTAAHSDASAKQPTYVGTWKVNTDKSEYPDPAMKPKSATLHITKWDANRIAWTYTGTDANGKAAKMSYSAPNDGKPHPVTGDPQMQSGTFKTSGNTVDITWTNAKGQEVGSEHATLSDDGKTFTTKETMKDKDGKDVSYTEVYEKAAGGAMNAAKKSADKK